MDDPCMVMVTTLVVSRLIVFLHWLFLVRSYSLIYSIMYLSVTLKSPSSMVCTLIQYYNESNPLHRYGYTNLI